jgi:hypothetical protein
MLRLLKDHQDFVVFLTDKNLGPAIIERKEYIRRALKDHLLDQETYKQLTDVQARNEFLVARSKVIQLFSRTMFTA